MARIGTTPSNRNSRDRKTASYLFTPPKTFISDWVPGSKAEDYIVSATIEAVKPQA
jgi:hypothetical protein